MWYYVHIQKRSFFYNQMSDKKYYNLYKDVKNKILTGEYPADTKLPSKRLMADKTGYSLITVERAYFMLEDEGYIAPRQRSGYFVCSIQGYIPNSAPTKIDIKYLPADNESPTLTT